MGREGPGGGEPEQAKRGQPEMERRVEGMLDHRYGQDAQHDGPALTETEPVALPIVGSRHGPQSARARIGWRDTRSVAHAASSRRSPARSWLWSCKIICAS